MNPLTHGFYMERVLLGKRCDSCGSEVPDIQIYGMWDVDGCIVIMARDEGDSLKKM